MRGLLRTCKELSYEDEATEVTCEIAHVKLMDECAQGRDAFDAVLIREREGFVEGGDDGLWNRGTPITTEVKCESALVKLMEGCAQDRDAFDAVLVHEQGTFVDRANDGLWICFEVLVDFLRQFVPVRAFNSGLHTGRDFNWGWWRRGSARLHQGIGSRINLRHQGSSEEERWDGWSVICKRKRRRFEKRKDVKFGGTLRLLIAEVGGGVDR